jgi:hypothetical protein
MAVFILTHGGWRWARILPLLEAKGHTVLTQDLPGAGSVATPLSPPLIRHWPCGAGHPPFRKNHPRNLALNENRSHHPWTRTKPP